MNKMGYLKKLSNLNVILNQETLTNMIKKYRRHKKCNGTS